jgi:hypothetical protein
MMRNEKSTVSALLCGPCCFPMSKQTQQHKLFEQWVHGISNEELGKKVIVPLRLAVILESIAKVYPDFDFKGMIETFKSNTYDVHRALLWKNGIALKFNSINSIN